MTALRKHQADILRVVDGIIAGDPTRDMIVHATPGAGKSALPIIAGKLISAGLADALCWICPRSALQDQGERNFLDPLFRQMLGHRLTIRSSTNDPDPCRGQRGFITTYQAIGADDRRSVLGEIRRRRYILILDEFHHCEQGGLWAGSVAPLVEHSAYRLFMSGTLARGDDKPIAFIPYTEELGADGKKFLRPAPDQDPATAFIQYTRTDALRERAILPIRFKLSDGRVSWEKNGRRKEGRLSHRIGDASQALFTALSTEFADHLLRDGVSHWISWKATHPRSKLLVVTANFEHAKRFKDALGFGLSSRSAIATSHDSPSALKAIHDFKFGNIDVLVTIAMAYEGLDVPQITHIISLTHIRTVPWIEQMIARAVRVDREAAGPYRSQMAFVFAPDDFLFRQVVEQIKAEQLPLAHEPETVKGEPKEDNGDGGEPINPLSGQVTDTREIALGSIPDGTPPDDPIMTVKEQEEDILHSIEQHVRKFSFDNRYKPQRISREIKEYFGKSRRHMTLQELKACLRWVRHNYPIATHSPEFLPDGVSRTRGTRQRVPTKAQPWPLPLFGGGE